MKNNPYLLISPAYPPPLVGGSKVWFYNMVENGDHKSFDILTSPLKSGFDEVVSDKHRVFRNKYIWDSNTKDPSTKHLIKSYLTILFWFWKRNKKVKYEVVIGGAFDFANGLLIILCKYLKIPIICLGAAEEFTLTLKGSGLKNFIKRSLLKFTHKRADGFIVSCHFCKDVLISIGVNSKIIYVIPSPVSPQKISSVNTNRFGGYNVLSVGRIIERKGFHSLILATKKLIKQFPKISTNIVGDGPYLPELKELIKINNLDNYIKLHGSISDESLSKLYEDANLFVLAHMMLDNGDTEGCPTVFAEASGQGIPIIGGTGAGATTAIEDGETGFIVDSRDIHMLTERMSMILKNESLAKKMSLKGIEKINKGFTPKFAGSEFYLSIDKLLKNYKHNKILKG